MSKAGIKKLKFPLKQKFVLLVAPSFIVDFSPSDLIFMSKKLGFDKVVELTFGAKMINREYHHILKNSNKLLISSACPGVVLTIENKYNLFKKNLAKIDSPMIAMGKICRKYFPKHKIVFLSPCDFKKIEAKNSKEIDYVIDYEELKELFKRNKIKKPFFRKKVFFDKFYNDYTKIYPLGGALSKTAHLKGILKDKEIMSLDGVSKVLEFLKKPKENIKFLDCLFCEGGCIGGIHTNKKLSLLKKRKKVLKYLKNSKKESIPEDRKGLIKKAKGLSFVKQ